MSPILPTLKADIPIRTPHTPTHTHTHTPTHAPLLQASKGVVSEDNLFYFPVYARNENHPGPTF